MFNSQESETQQQLNAKFYDLQQQFIEQNSLPTRKKDYLNNDFFQEIVTKYQLDKCEENGWLFGKALDILIRNNISSKSFIQYNEETKQDFYSNAMYRCNNYTINSFKPEMNAFIYFTSTIKNAFKEEINKSNEQKSLARQSYVQNGLDAIMYNVSVKESEALHQEYIVDQKIEAILEDVPMFIKELHLRYSKEYKIQSMSIVEDANVHRFQKKYHKFETFIPVITTKTKEISEKSGKSKVVYKHQGVVVQYIDVRRVNENLGQFKTYLQKRNLIARRNGHQVFFLFSDIWNDETIKDSFIFAKLDLLIRGIKENFNYNTGKDLNLDFIPYSLIEEQGVTEPVWWLLDPEPDNRHIVLDQSVEEYLKYKDINPNFTRVYDSGYLKV